MTDSIQWKSIQRLKALIAAQLQWGESDQWSNYDFDKFSALVAEKTGVTLSVSTLKRVFGRVNYQSAPSLTTLNTLSRFAGFEDWRAFTSPVAEEEQVQEAAVDEPIIEKAPTSKRQRRFSFFKILLPAVAFALVGFITLNLYSRKQKPGSSTFHFSSKTILTEGVPNSVVFDYDASAARDEDSIFIAQSWDIRRKIPVSKNDKHHSAIYYYPGYFRAKLMIGSEIVREHDVQIKTNGWLGLIEAEWGKEPFYFKKEEINWPNEILIDNELLKKYNISQVPAPPDVRLFNQKDIHNITTDNFIFETEVKTDSSTGVNGCRRVEILLHAKNDILFLPLVSPACIGDVYLAAYGFMTESKKEDLSGFGCNLQEWTRLKIACKNGYLEFFINDKQVYTATIKNSPSEIVGVQYRFKGAGAVRNTQLTGANNKKVVF